jgi:nucleotidyltransferase/DNA polymerase involved in DNA repair
MAGLPDSVYDHKLIVVDGRYRLQSPIGILKGVGPQAIDSLNSIGIHKIIDLLNYPLNQLPIKLHKHHQTALQDYGHL